MYQGILDHRCFFLLVFCTEIGNGFVLGSGISSLGRILNGDAERGKKGKNTLASVAFLNQ